MIDVNRLVGAPVRTADGLDEGRILEVRLPEVRVGWDDPEELLLREEVLHRDDSQMESLEVLTLQGWANLARLLSEDEVLPGRLKLVEHDLVELAGFGRKR